MSLILVVVIILFGLYVFFKIRRKRKIEEMRNTYQEALKGTDKAYALTTGRIYYSALRSKGTASFSDGVLTTYDEAALNNDIATMKC